MDRGRVPPHPNPPPQGGRELRLEVATPDDAEVFANMETACRPDEPSDPVVTRVVLGGGLSSWDVTFFVVCAADRPVGFAWVAHPPAEEGKERTGVLEASLVPAELAPGRLAALFDMVEERALAAAPARLFADCSADDEAAISELGRRGYRLEREERIWELDLVERREHVLAERERLRTAMEPLGVRMATLADCPGPGVDEEVLRMMNLATRDVPSAVPHVDLTLEHFRCRLALPDRRRDRFWVAWRDGHVVAMSYLLFPPVRGNVWTGFTGTDPGHRGLGIARAVKMESLGQAIEVGVPRVRTGNDTENTPILRINESLGYRMLPGRLTFVRA